MDHSTALAVMLLIAGYLLVGADVFVPGFSWPGMVGAACLAVGIFLLADSIVNGIIMAVAAAALCMLIVWGVSRLKKEKIAGASPDKMASGADESVSNGQGLSEMTGTSGFAVTELRPSGVARFGSTEYDVVSSSGFIPKGAEITVTQAEGYRLVVKEKHEQ